MMYLPRLCLPPLAIFIVMLFNTISVVEASYAKIANYEPGSDVVQHNRIDLDQADFETKLAETTPDWAAADNIYDTGGNSGPVVTLTVTALAADIPKGTNIQQGGTSTSPTAVGILKSDATQGATTIQVTVSGTTCVQGAALTQVTTGCFTQGGGNILSGTNGATDLGAATADAYTYRTEAGFSTDSWSKMEGQKFYNVYVGYWGVKDYANQFVMSGLNGDDREGVFLMNGKVNDYRVQVAKKGSVYWNIWMYVIREMEDAVSDCTAGCLNCNDAPVHAWDEAVAFYTGSLEGSDGSGSGKLLHALADKRCMNYGTCTNDNDGNKKTGYSAVNKDILTQFNLGQAKLLQGKCSEVPAIKDRIVEIMSVPLVQGALRYAYKVAELSGGDKEKAEMVAFTGAILPRVAACNTADAAKIRSNMFTGDTVNDGFAVVKQAFEDNYACMGMTCADIGGLMLNDGYYTGFSPCTTSTASSDDKGDCKGELTGLVILACLLAMLLTVAATMYFMGGKIEAPPPPPAMAPVQAIPVQATPMDNLGVGQQQLEAMSKV